MKSLCHGIPFLQKAASPRRYRLILFVLFMKREIQVDFRELHVGKGNLFYKGYRLASGHAGLDQLGAAGGDQRVVSDMPLHKAMGIQGLAYRVQILR